MTRHAPAFFGSGLFPGSALGVDLFFVMSGFVISYAYDSRLRDGLSAWEFTKIRLVRLYPLYGLGTVIGIGVAAAVIVTGTRSAATGFSWQPMQLLGTALPAVLLLPAPPIGALDDALYPLNAVAWSLAFEIVVNVLYAASFRAWTVPRLAMAAGAGAVLLIAAGISFQSLDLGWNWNNGAAGTGRILYSFPVGILIHRLSAAGGLRLPVRPHWAVPLAIALFCFATPLPETLRLAADMLIVLIGFPLVTILAVRASMPSGLVRLATFLGVTSYAAYALHRPLLSMINGVAQVLHLHIERFAPWSGPAFVAALLAICWVVDRYYDQPVRQFLAQRLRRQTTEALRHDGSGGRI